MSPTLTTNVFGAGSTDTHSDPDHSWRPGAPDCEQAAIQHFSTRGKKKKNGGRRTNRREEGYEPKICVLTCARAFELRRVMQKTDCTRGLAHECIERRGREFKGDGDDFHQDP